MDDAVSVGTSADDRTDENDESISRDMYLEGIMLVLRPATEKLDERVRSVRMSQAELRQQIDNLADDLKIVQENHKSPVELESYMKKLLAAKRRISLINNIVQNVQERLTRIRNGIKKETAKRKSLMDSSLSSPM